MGLELQRYINDHLNGSNRALDLTHDLMANQKYRSLHPVLADLAHDIQRDREALKGLLSKAGLDCDSSANTTRSYPLVSTDGDAREMGATAALEMIALSIQGKRLLWVALSALVPWFPEWHPLDFRMLELDAIRQKDCIGKILADLGDKLPEKQCLAFA